MYIVFLGASPTGADCAIQTTKKEWRRVVAQARAEVERDPERGPAEPVDLCGPHGTIGVRADRIIDADDLRDSRWHGRRVFVRV